MDATLNTPEQASVSASIKVESPSQRSSVVAVPLQVLRSAIDRKASGRLIFQEIDHSSVSWCVHIGDGQIHFASSLIGQRERLAYMLRRAAPQLSEQLPVTFTQLDYKFLHQLWQANILELAQLRRLVYLLTQEALIHILTLHESSILFNRIIGLDPILLSVPLKDSLVSLRPQVEIWKRLKPQITSPFQRACLVAREKLVRHFENQLNQLQGPNTQYTLLQALEDQPCLYDLARRLDTSLIQAATVLAKLVRVGVIEMKPFAFAPPSDPCLPTIACIDDSLAHQNKIQLMLETMGYRVLSLTDPIKAPLALVREKPALVLMDISMPHLNGYELCRTLRKHPLFAHIPIIMVTGNSGIIDRAKAKLVGASDYLTKPFTQAQLLKTIFKYIALPTQH